MTNSMNRRRFLEKASAAGAVLSSGPFILNAAQDKTPSRLSYDISRFSVTDPKLIGFQEERRFAKVAERPRRIWSDPKGGFLVACNKGAIEFNSDGVAAKDYVTKSPARSIARDPSGTTFVATNEGIHLFGPDAKQSAFWPALDAKTWITGIDFDEETVFAADSGNRVILRYDRSGKVVKRIGTKDKERNVPGIILPSPYLDVKVAPDGLLRVNNTGRHRIEAYTKEGDLEFFWGKPTAAIEGFCGCCNPIALDVLPDGRYLTCEKGLPRVKLYSSEGAFQTVVAGPESFPENSRQGAARAADGTMGGLDAAPGPEGSLMVLDLVTADVCVMRPKSK